jgi:cysteine desulfurase
MDPPIHLDHNATTPPAPAVVGAMGETLAEAWGNPSSIHRGGIAARARVEIAREQVARLLGCRPREVVFTSGGTESANLAIRGSLAVGESQGRSVLLSSRLEHSAVRECMERLVESGIEVLWVPHHRDGLVDLAALDEVLRDRGREIALASLMAANNETGVLTPIAEVGERCRRAGVRLHVDATQWVGRLPLDLSALPVDLLTCSAHKFHGPKGVGALVVRGAARIAPQIVGGPQERERRGGTENVPGIVGMGVAAELAQAWLDGEAALRVAALRDRFERAVLAGCEGAVVHGAAAPRLWNTTNIGFPRLEAEAILLVLSERGVYASAGAACSSGSLDPSPVLLAMGIPPEIAHGSVRFSLGRDASGRELERAAREVVEAVARLGRSLPAAR